MRFRLVIPEATGLLVLLDYDIKCQAERDLTDNPGGK